LAGSRIFTVRSDSAAFSCKLRAALLKQENAGYLKHAAFKQNAAGQRTILDCIRGFAFGEIPNHIAAWL
jgi:hypothetical protein